jgi:hypothetical protein
LTKSDNRVKLERGVNTVLIKVEVSGLDDATLMQKLQLKGPRELELFKLIWKSGDEGVADFPVKDSRKRIYFLRQRFRETGLGLDIVTLGNGRYVFPRATHEKIAHILNALPLAANY